MSVDPDFLLDNVGKIRGFIWGVQAAALVAIFTCFAILAIFVVAAAQEKQANICATHCGEGVSWSFTDRSCTCGVTP